MSVEVKEILAGQAVIDPNGGAAPALVEVIQRLVRAMQDQEARILALEARVTVLETP